MFESFGEIKARVISGRYGNPLRGATIILVAGAYGKSTAVAYLRAILEEAGRPAVILSEVEGYDESENGIFRAAAEVKKKGKTIILLEVNDKLLRSPALRTFSIDTLILTSDDAASNDLLHLTPKHVVAPSSLSVPPGTVEPYQHISFGDEDASEAKIDSIKLFSKGSELKLTIDHQTKLEVATYLSGLASARTLTASVAAAYVLGVSLSAVQEGVANVERLTRRFELIHTDTPYKIFVDVASHARSFELALDSAKQLTKRRLLVVFDENEPDDIVDYAKAHSDRVFMVSDDASTRTDIDTARSLKGAVEKATRGAKQGDSILLLGKSYLGYDDREIDELIGVAEKGEES